MLTFKFAADRAADRWEQLQPIDFMDILAATVVEEERSAESPWHDCDGWEHTFTPYSKLPWRLNTDDLRDAAGWVTGGSYGSNRGLITIDLDVVKKKWMGEYSKLSGEHRQVYEERMAATRQRAIKQLVKWYNHGWECWYVKCEYMDEESSCGGIYCERDDAYIEEHRRAAAFEVAHTLQKHGRVLINLPPPYNARRLRLQHKRDAIARHMGFSEYKDYRRWVRTPCSWGGTIKHYMLRRRGWPRKDEVARIYRDRDKQSYFIVFVPVGGRTGNWDAVANAFSGSTPALCSTSVSPVYVAKNWLKRMTWDELPVTWQRAFRPWLQKRPEMIRGFWRVGDQPE